MKRKPKRSKSIRSAEADSERPQLADIIEWMKFLTEPSHSYKLWIKKSKDKYLGGYFSSGQLGKFSKSITRLSGTVFGVYWSINPVATKLVTDETDHRLKVGEGVPQDADIVRRHWLPIDIDPERQTDISATNKEKQRAKDRTFEVGRYLDGLGWPRPVIVDSGNGFYLLYRVDLPTDDSGLVSRVLKAIGQKFSDDHVKIDTKVANAGRVLKIPGTMACKGKSTKDRPHRFSRVMRRPESGPQVVSSELLENLAGNVEPKLLPKASVENTAVPHDVVEQVRRYIDRIPKAIQGQNGSSATLTVATRVVVDFNIAHDSDAALQLMREYSQRCQPPWTDKELRHKLKEADRLATEKGEPRGHLRNDQHDGTALSEWAPLSGSKFLIQVPDYELVATNQVLRPIDEFSKLSPWYGLSVYLVWKCQRSDALIPDVVLRQAYWGATAPTAWRRSFLNKLGTSRNQAECRPDCVLFGSQVRHQHLVRHHEVSNNGLELFSKSAIKSQIVDPARLAKLNKKGHRRYRYNSKKPAVVKLRGIYHSAFYYCYMPLLIFGRSRRLGLTPRQVRLMLGVTRELTRVGMEPQFPANESGKVVFKKAYSPRKDRAAIIVDRKVVPSGEGKHKILCPQLIAGHRYVVFGGNTKGHVGRGCRLFNEKIVCWLNHAGYSADKFNSDPWPSVRTFLDDLAVLAEMFDLVVVGRHHARKQWKSLDQLRACLKSGSGQDWLKECTVRIFAPEDFLIRWRYRIAKKLGFSSIPGGENCPFNETSNQGDGQTISDGTQLRAWLDQQGWSIRQLADRMACSRKTVSRHLHDKRKSSDFLQRVNELVKKLSN